MGMAFIVIQHLSKDYRSILDQLLTNYTYMPVIRVTENIKVEPNHIYLITENSFIKIQDDIIRVLPRKPDEIINRAVNIFLKSLAVNSKEKAIGIILTGMGIDGLEGAKAIRREGGVVYVQDPATTEYKGMPVTAIEEDHPIEILAPEELARMLVSTYR
jgi:two-component system, chemotaxis family, protein-glutamate methylesterase/glutaminase